MLSRAVRLAYEGSVFGAFGLFILHFLAFLGLTTFLTLLLALFWAEPCFITLKGLVSA